ncbi:MAG: tripartite tricarboxylate transporter permease [Rhodobacteraceae bacterium]|nr:tripartite tricarboxylate transporter permease [Paracoccaceae bacterium]
MDLLTNLAYGFQVVLTWNMLMFCFIGVALGTFVGVLPGIGAFSALAMLLPITFHFEPAAGLIMLAGFYYGALYGGSTASILLNMPGTPSAAITCLEGYPMTQKGRAGVALTMTAVASFFGGTFSFLLIALLALPLARVATSFGAPEYTSMLVLGLVVCSTVTGGSIARGLAMMAFGLILGVVGLDLASAEARYTFGQVSLLDGVSLVALAMGLLGVPEILFRLSDADEGARAPVGYGGFRALMPTWPDIRDSIMPMFRGSTIGALLGILPGTGATIASFLSYAAERSIARDKSTFGTGRIEGLTSPEAANNSAAQSAFIPTLTLGIPGDPVMALMIGALMIHGIQPGPLMLRDHADVFWGLIASFWIGNLMLLVLNIPFVGLWVRLLRIPYRLLYPGILVFVCLGVYSVRNNVADLIVLMAAAALACVLRMLRLSPIPLLLGFVLGTMLEQNMRRALMISSGDAMIFLTRPISLGFLVASALFAVLIAMGIRRQNMAARREPEIATEGRNA